MMTNGTLNHAAEIIFPSIEEQARILRAAVERAASEHAPQTEPQTEPTQETETSAAMAELLRVQAIIARKKSEKIEFQRPVVVRGADAIFARRTVVVIQGKSGRHKSRFVGDLCSTILKKRGYDAPNDHLGFRLNGVTSDDTAILYVDTERNIYDQFPAALQIIQRNAGFAFNEDLGNFDYISLLSIDRDQRFSVFVEYLERTRRKHQNKHLFVVLDVITDLIASFNDVRESLKLVDLLNATINHFDVTFLAVIHENPTVGESKARGHLGTELTNKASAVIALDFVRDEGENETDVLCVRFVKLRNAKRPEPFYAKYNDFFGALEITEKPQYTESRDERKREIVRSVFKGVCMTKSIFARDYANIRGLKPESTAGYSLFADAIRAGWIVPANEKTEQGDELFWFVDDKPSGEFL
jgi:hypothetical protein